MTAAGRRRAAIVLLLAVLLAAAGWWFDARTKPARVGPRFVDALATRRPGTAVTILDGGMVRAAFVSGTLVDVRLSAVFDTCAEDRFGCSAAIDRAAADVQAADGLARAPRGEALRPVVLSEAAGYRYGYVTEPLAGALELRYALVAGLAWTYVTAAMADRLHLPRPALRAAALSNLRADAPAVLEKTDEAGAPVFRVRSAGDPAASLIDDERMRRFADEVGSRRLYLVVPTRGTLAIGPATTAAAGALDALRVRLRGTSRATLDSGLLAYDVDAPADRRLTLAVASP